jgi:hypothetical protein
MRKLLPVLLLMAFTFVAAKPILSAFVPSLAPAFAHAQDDDDQGEDEDVD